MGERVVLGSKAPGTWAGFRWTGREPDGMFEPEQAVAFGAQWEGDDLVTYDLQELRHTFEHYGDNWIADSD